MERQDLAMNHPKDSIEHNPTSSSIENEQHDSMDEILDSNEDEQHDSTDETLDSNEGKQQSDGISDSDDEQHDSKDEIVNSHEDEQHDSIDEILESNDEQHDSINKILDPNKDEQVESKDEIHDSNENEHNSIDDKLDSNENHSFEKANLKKLTYEPISDESDSEHFLVEEYTGVQDHELDNFLKKEHADLEDFVNNLQDPSKKQKLPTAETTYSDESGDDLELSVSSHDHHSSSESLTPQALIDSIADDMQDPEDYKRRSDEAEIGLACPKCLQSFNDSRVPQTLPECQHVCCTNCLMHLSKWDAISNIECPRCGKTSKLPNGGTAAMEPNEWLHRFVQRHQQGKLGEHLADISHDLQGMQEDVDTSVETLLQLEKDTKDALKMEEENVDRCVEAVQAEAWVLKAQIRKIGEHRLKYLQQDIAQLQSRAQDIRMVHDITKASQENGNIQHIKYDQLSSQMDKLLVATTPVANSMSSPQVARFLRENLTLGRVIKLRNLQLVYEFADRFKEVQDILVTPNGLLALCDREGYAVTVHSKGKLDNNNASQYTTELSLDLNPDNPYPPTGIAATLDGKYIVARRTGIEVYSMTGDYQKTYTTCGKTKSPVAKCAPYVYSLTTTEDGKIVAGDIDRKLITIHDVTGDIISTIHTAIKPRCIAPAWEKHLVAITDWESGRLIVQHIGSGSQVLMLDIPDALGICYDRGSGSLLVSRSERDPKTGDIRAGTGVIEQYNSSGDRTLIVCLAQDLYGAYAMEFISNDMLAVADYKAVKFYQVT